MLRKTMILAVSLTVSACTPYIAPDSWTIRNDCRIRASQRNEDFDIQGFIAKVQKEDGQDFGIVLTPAGAKSISDEIKSCHIDLQACEASHK